MKGRYSDDRLSEPFQGKVGHYTVKMPENWSGGVME